MVTLSIDGLTKRYDDAQGTETAVDDVSLTVEDELLVLLGPSGCGKTTILRTIAGLESATEGRITVDGLDVTDRHPSDRSIAMVFQDYGLYTTMSVRKNMAYGLKHSTDLSRDERADRVEAMAELFGIEALLDREIDQLSGGQKQRVALGRAMVREPDVFLLDEPLASLDAKLRSEMRTELQQLQADLDITTVYVTHDQKEAMTMGDRVAILDDGVLQQHGPPVRRRFPREPGDEPAPDDGGRRRRPTRPPSRDRQWSGPDRVRSDGRPLAPRRPSHRHGDPAGGDENLVGWRVRRHRHRHGVSGQR